MKSEIIFNCSHCDHIYNFRKSAYKHATDTGHFVHGSIKYFIKYDFSTRLHLKKYDSSKRPANL
jgi:uncharacterized C2H2 Zn-finger protein